MYSSVRNASRTAGSSSRWSERSGRRIRNVRPSIGMRSVTSGPSRSSGVSGGTNGAGSALMGLEPFDGRQQVRLRQRPVGREQQVGGGAAHRVEDDLPVVGGREPLRRG